MQDEDDSSADPRGCTGGGLRDDKDSTPDDFTTGFASSPESTKTFSRLKHSSCTGEYINSIMMNAYCYSLLLILP